MLLSTKSEYQLVIKRQASLATLDETGEAGNILIMEESPKKTVYIIYCSNKEKWRETVNKLFARNFVYREPRWTDTDTILREFGWGSHIVLFAHPICKRVILSESGDNLILTDEEFNRIQITVDDFIAQGLYLY